MGAGIFPQAVRDDLTSHYLQLAGERMNASASLGTKAQQLVARFRNSSLNDDFEIEETPRAVHQPYLTADRTPRDKFFTEPTGVFNTAELLINQVELTSPRCCAPSPTMTRRLSGNWWNPRCGSALGGADVDKRSADPLVHR